MSGIEPVIVAPIVISGTMLAIKCYEMARDKIRRRKEMKRQRKYIEYQPPSPHGAALFSNPYGEQALNKIESTLQGAKDYIQKEVDTHFRLGTRFNQGDAMLQQALQHICTAIQRDIVTPVTTDIALDLTLFSKSLEFQAICKSHSHDIIQELWNFKNRFDASLALVPHLRYDELNRTSNNNSLGLICPKCPDSGGKQRLFAMPSHLQQHIEAKHSNPFSLFTISNPRYTKEIDMDIVPQRAIEEVESDDDNIYKEYALTKTPEQREHPLHLYNSPSIPRYKKATAPAAVARSKGSGTGMTVLSTTVLCAGTAAVTTVIVLNPAIGAAAGAAGLGVMVIGRWLAC